MKDHTMRLPDDLKKELEDAVIDASDAVQSYSQCIQDRLRQEWLDAGGCESCHGRGWRVTWDTMDVMDGGCHKSGPCNNENCTAKTVGREPCYSDKYDNFHKTKRVDDAWGNTAYEWDVKVSPKFHTNEKEREKIQQLLKTRHEAEMCRNAADEVYTPYRGRRIEVVRGRKIACGTQGTVFWRGEDSFANNLRYGQGGKRIGFKSDDGEKLFIKEDYVIVLTEVNV